MRARRPRPTVALCAAALLAATGMAAEAGADCEGFRWNMAHELELFHSTALPLAAATEVANAPVAALDRLVEITLADEPGVRFAVPPGAHRRVAAPAAGLILIDVPAPGHYRISADGPVWIDVVDGETAVAASDFNGHPRCQLIHKSVDYAFQAAGRFLVQLSQAPARRVRIGLTQAPAAP